MRGQRSAWLFRARSPRPGNEFRLHTARAAACLDAKARANGLNVGGSLHCDLHGSRTATQPPSERGSGARGNVRAVFVSGQEAVVITDERPPSRPSPLVVSVSTRTACDHLQNASSPSSDCP
jgi:hypothetical protein